MAKFMLIVHEHPNNLEKLPADEKQRVSEKFQGWMDKIRSSGRYVVSDKLQNEGGKVLTRQHGRLQITDGPYSEVKEVVGGYMTIRAANYEEAVEIIRDSPFLDYCRLELRQTDPMGCGEE